MTDLHDIAAEWQLRLAAGELDAAAEAELERWLARDPRHRLALADAGAAWFGAANAAFAPPRRPAARAARAARWLAWAGGAAAAPLLVVLFFAAPAWWAAWRSDAHTAAGETRTIALADGSEVTLDSDSAIAVDYSDARRALRVLRGAAFFTVQPDAARPFVVTAGDLTASAIGTAYAVEHTGAGVVVAVEQGTVAVGRDGDARYATLTAGQALRVARDRAEPAAADDHLAFHRGVLAFEATPLAAAFERIDRHLQGRVLLLDDAAGAQPITAVFPLADAELALDALTSTHGLTVLRLPGLYVVR